MNNPDVPQEFRVRLDALRGAIRSWFVIDGASRLVLLLGGLSVLSFAIDYFLHMDRAQRAVYLVLTLGGFIGLAIQRIVRPLGVAVSDDQLSLAVEYRKRELGQSLISGLQFSRLLDPAAEGLSATLVAATIAQGREKSTAVDFTEVIDHHKRKQNLLRMGAVVLAFAILTAGAPGFMNLWFKRNVLLQNESWPRTTHLQIVGIGDDNTIHLPEGDDLDVIVEKMPGSDTPDMVNIETRSTGGAVTDPEQMPAVEESYRRKYKTVLTPFEFRVSGGDYESAWIQVKLRDRPELTALTVTITPPAYTKEPAKEYPGSLGTYRLLKGSQVTLRGTSSKLLSKAEIYFTGKLLMTFTPTGKRNFVFDLRSDQVHGGMYGVRLYDQEELTNRKPTRVNLQVRPDTKPRISARLNGISDIILSRARIPIEMKLRDDFAVMAAWIMWNSTAEDGTPGADKKVTLSQFKEKAGQAKIVYTEAMEVGGFDLSPGMHLVFRVEATDNDTVSGPKVGQSSPFSLRVVNEADLRKALLRREQDLRQRFEKLFKKQKKLLENSRVMRAALRQTTKEKPLSSKQWSTFARASKGQRLAARQLTRIADLFTRILNEVQNNRLEDKAGRQPMQARLRNNLINPVVAIAAKLVPAAADRLAVTNKEKGTPATRDAALDEAITLQAQIVQRMLAIRKHMVDSEGIQEAVNLLREILQRQKKLRKDTEGAQQEDLEGLFGD